MPAKITIPGQSKPHLMKEGETLDIFVQPAPEVSGSQRINIEDRFVVSTVFVGEHEDEFTLIAPGNGKKEYGLNETPKIHKRTAILPGGIIVEPISQAELETELKFEGLPIIA